MSDDILTARHAPRPMVVSLRFRCGCVGREVLTESMVLDFDMPEEAFVWSMKRLRQNALAVIAQHLKPREDE
jgi:hypothetical protein